MGVRGHGDGCEGAMGMGVRAMGMGVRGPWGRV